MGKLLLIDMRSYGANFSERLEAALPKRHLRGNARAGSLVAEAAVRLALAARKISPHIPILRTEHGKPYVEAGLHFNLSHTEGLAVCAFSEVPVGVDAERIEERDVLALSKRFFSAEEAEIVARADDPLRAFYRLWTAKESVLKMRGETLAALSSVCGGAIENVRSYEFSGERLSPTGELPKGEALFALSVCGDAETVEIVSAAAVAEAYLSLGE